jgi:competence protein ComEC
MNRSLALHSVIRLDRSESVRFRPFHWHGLGGILIVLALAFHQQIQLLPSWWFGVGSLCCVVVAALVGLLPQVRHRFCHIILLCSLCLLAWFSWTDQAQQRLDDRLAAQWEGREIQVTGLIASMPQQKQFAQRFDFLISSVQSDSNIRLPKKIVLSWSPLFANDAAIKSRRTTELVESTQHLEPGQLWTFAVKLKRPVGSVNFEGFDSELNSFRQNIGAYGVVQKDQARFHCSLWCWAVWQSDLWPSLGSVALERLRLMISQSLDELTPLSGERATGVIKALAIGEQSAINALDWRLFNRTGVSHLMSISGMHVTMTAAIAAWCTVFLWNRCAARMSLPQVARLPNRRRLAWVFAIGAALFYCALAGWGIPAQRTVFTVVLIGLLAHQRSGFSALWVLQTVALCILVLDPWAVLSIGFWLSFLAVAGLMLQGGKPDQLSMDRDERAKHNREQYCDENRDSYDPQKSVIEKSPKRLIAEHFFKHTLVQAVRAQWACTWILLPALAYFFGSISAISVVANAIAIPLIGLIVTPLALACAALAVLLPTAAMPLAAALVQGIAWLLKLLFVFLQWLDQSLAAQWIVGQPSLLVTALATVLIMSALARSWLPFFASSRWHYFFKVILLAASTALLIFPTVSKSSNGNVWSASFFDVGHGSAVLVKSGDQVLLFDTGPQQSIDNDAGSNTIVPALRLMGIQKIDLLVLSHMDSGHLGGFQAILDAMPIDRIWASLPQDSVPLQKIANAKARVISEQCHAGRKMMLNNLSIQALHPPKPAEHEVNTESSDSVLSDSKPAPVKPSAKKVDYNVDSCVLMITSGAQKLLLTADIQAKQERWLVQHYGPQLKADVLAMPGQGAASGSSLAFLQAVQPVVAIAQVGYRNRWRTPEKVAARYQQLGIKIERTDRQGAVRIQLGQGADNPVFTAKSSLDSGTDRSITVQTARQERDAYWRIKP